MANISSEELGWQTSHSAFKIKVKPRQNLEKVNVKLMEVQMREAQRKARANQHHQLQQQSGFNVNQHPQIGMTINEPKANSGDDNGQVETFFITELNTNPNQATESLSNLDANNNPNLLNFGFRPPTVKKPRSNSFKIISNSAKYTSMQLHAAANKSAQCKTITGDSVYRSIKTATTSISETNKIENNGGDGLDELRDSSGTSSFINIGNSPVVCNHHVANQQNRFYNHKVTSEIFHEIYSTVFKDQPTRLNSSKAKASSPRVTTTAYSFMSVQPPSSPLRTASSIRIPVSPAAANNNETSSATTIKQQQSLIKVKNMNEKDFLNLLQEYRKSKTIDTQLINKVKDESKQPQAKSTNINEASNSSQVDMNFNNEAKFMNLKTENFTTNINKLMLKSSRGDESSRSKQHNFSKLKKSRSAGVSDRQFANRGTLSVMTGPGYNLNGTNFIKLNMVEAKTTNTGLSSGSSFSLVENDEIIEKSCNVNNNSNNSRNKYTSLEMIDERVSGITTHKISSFYLNYLENRILNRSNKIANNATKQSSSSNLNFSRIKNFSINAHSDLIVVPSEKVTSSYRVVPPPSARSKIQLHQFQSKLNTSLEYVESHGHINSFVSKMGGGENIRSGSGLVDEIKNRDLKTEEDQVESLESGVTANIKIMSISTVAN